MTALQVSLERLREANGGKFPSYVWPGGYPLLYTCADGSNVCADCANEYAESADKCYDCGHVETDHNPSPSGDNFCVFDSGTQTWSGHGEAKDDVCNCSGWERSDAPDDRIVEWFIYYEGPEEACAICDKTIASAYGDPDAEPTAPSDGDYVMSPSGPLGGRTSVSEHGYKFLAEFSNEDDAIEFIKMRMSEQGVFTTVWELSDHGNYSIVNLDYQEKP